MKTHMHDHVGLPCRHLRVTSPAENDGDSSHQKNKEDTRVWSSCSSYHADTSNKNFLPSGRTAVEWQRTRGHLLVGGRDQDQTETKGAGESSQARTLTIGIDISRHFLCHASQQT
jgi:hypothetical protein